MEATLGRLPLLVAELSLGLNAANMTFPLILHRLFRIKKNT